MHVNEWGWSRCPLCEVPMAVVPLVRPDGGRRVWGKCVNDRCRMHRPTVLKEEGVTCQIQTSLA